MNDLTFQIISSTVVIEIILVLLFLVDSYSENFDFKRRCDYLLMCIMRNWNVTLRNVNYKIYNDHLIECSWTRVMERNIIIKEVKEFLHCLNKDFWIKDLNMEIENCKVWGGNMEQVFINCHSILETMLYYRNYKNHGSDFLHSGKCGENYGKCTSDSCYINEKKNIMIKVMIYPIIDALPHLPRKLRKKMQDVLGNDFELNVTDIYWAKEFHWGGKGESRRGRIERMLGVK